MAVRVGDSVELANRLRPVLLQLNRHLRREAHAEGITGGQAALLAQIRNDPDARRARARRARGGLRAGDDPLPQPDGEGRARRRGRRRPTTDAAIRLALTPKGVRASARSAAGAPPGWPSGSDGLSRAELRSLGRGDRAAHPATRGGRVTAALLALNSRTFTQPAQAPQLPPLLHRPDHLGHRQLDAGHRAALARARADPLAGRRRPARLCPLPAVHGLRPLLGRARRPLRQPPRR